MQVKDLQERYGLYLSEIIRQAITLEEFNRMNIEELVPYFEKRSSRAYEEYRTHQKLLPPEHGPLTTQNEYLDILRRRWQEAEDMAYEVLKAEREACNREAVALEA